MPGPIVIGVAGGSGSGKTTVVRKIVDSVGDGNVTVVEHDRYYAIGTTFDSKSARRSTTTTLIRPKPS